MKSGSAIGRPPQVALWPHGRRLLLLLAAAALAVAEYGFYTQPIPGYVHHVVQTALLVLYAGEVLRQSRADRTAGRLKQADWADWSLLAIGFAVSMVSLLLQLEGLWWPFQLCVVLLLVSELWRMNVALARRFRHPGLLLPVSFLTLIVVGTPLVMLPRSAPPGHGVSFIDALFTMTSAVCVTGLIVRDTATQFTPFGQAIIGVFIQLGGLGIIVFGSVMAMLMGGRRSLSSDMTLSQVLDDQPLRRVASYVRFIVLTTLLLELLGAACMAPLWPDPDPAAPLSWERRFGVSVFHAVSAFCNAGFALQSDSLEGLRYSPIAHLVIAPLIVVGGLGFPVLDNVFRAALWRLGRRQRLPWRAADPTDLAEGRLSLHTKLVLTATAGLYLYGVIFLAAAQLKPRLDAGLHQGQTANQRRPEPMSAGGLGGVLADASFQSLTARTAGFNTMPMDDIAPAGRFVLVTLMLVGASPGGTGGGMKTTTLTLILLGVVATARRSGQPQAFGRSITEEMVRRAGGLAAGIVLLATVATLLLSYSEPFPFEKVAFEAVSAATTTGLSLGITAHLTAFGKGVIIATMYLGRIGPLALLGMFILGGMKAQPYAYARENVILG